MHRLALVPHARSVLNLLGCETHPQRWRSGHQTPPGARRIVFPVTLVMLAPQRSQSEKSPAGPRTLSVGRFSFVVMGMIVDVLCGAVRKQGRWGQNTSRCARRIGCGCANRKVRLTPLVAMVASQPCLLPERSSASAVTERSVPSARGAPTLTGWTCASSARRRRAGRVTPRP